MRLPVLAGLTAAIAVLAGSPASAQQPAAGSEVELQAPGPNGALAGTMVEAGAGAPVVLIVPGSGPTDRNGDNPLGVAGGIYRQVAQGLAARGVASVRIDKRGLFGSHAAIPDPSDVTIADYAADVHNWIAVIRKRNAVPCVWVMGHSEGGLVALVAAQQPGDICGLLLVSSMGRSMGEVFRAQFRANPANAPILAAAMSTIDALEAGRTVDPATLPSPLDKIFYAKVQRYLINAYSYDPTLLAAAYKGPMLILQGKRDLQVALEDAMRLKNAHPAARLVTLDDVNHVLKPVTGDSRGANVATYADASLPIDPAVTDAIATMVLAQPRR